jgi:asparagine synthase (glutamine-hydrolysing)
MCGFAGFLTPSPNFSSPEGVLRNMGAAIRSRGPDSKGQFFDLDNGIGLSFRRLAILDISEAGSQPMRSISGRFIICFNGEIYNHQEIRKEIEHKSLYQIIWNGHSDTETLLASIELFGFEETLKKCTGMFAIALWDKKEKVLSFARDRFGEKPLYYGWAKKSLIFGSELKALKSFPGFESAIDKRVIPLFTKFNYIPAPFSIYKDCYKLMPAEIIRYKIENNSCTKLEQKSFWTAESIIKSSQANPVSCFEEAKDLIETSLEKSVKSQMLSDVPLGAFLSGGIDSSLITALMQKNSMEKIQTFTAKFESASLDESKMAKNVADYIGSDNIVATVSDKEALEVIQTLSKIYDEPFADSSQIPTTLISSIAKKNVSVALSGDAGDEVFGGYNRYRWGPYIWNKVINYSPVKRKLLLKSLHVLNSNQMHHLENIVNSVLPTSLKISLLNEKVKKIQLIANHAKSSDDVYKLLTENRINSDLYISDRDDVSYNDIRLDNQHVELDIAHKMMMNDTLTYLPDDILCKVDRASMSVSLETRIPFLNHELFALAWRLPIEMKVKQGDGKFILKEILGNYVPTRLFNRPKAGFAVPLAQWLRGPLRDWAESLLDEQRINDDGYFNFKELMNIWNLHLSGSKDMTNELWSVLMFQAWRLDE